MKRLISNIILIVISLHVYAQTIDHRQVGGSLPDFRLVNRAGVSYTQQDITEGRNFFLVLFNPTCGHCVEFASSLMEHKELFEENTIFFMAASDMLPYLPRFIDESKWQDGGELMMGVDSAETLHKVYTYTTLPQINVYDSSYKLIKIFGALNSIDSLKPYIY